jgi:NAD(P)-dependent dehydrogenase (short-subunit alcohol dehydrogenase family)
VAVVIGGTSGIGRAIAGGLARAGADVVPTSRRDDAVRAAVDEFCRHQVRRLAQPVDVTSAESIDRLRDAVLATFGRVDILVNAAGVHLRRESLSLSLAEWNEVLAINLSGTFLACQSFGGPLLERAWGRIINIASLGSYVGLHQAAAYSVSKAGVLALTRCLGAEWAPRGVCVNALVPGVFVTPINRKLLDGTDRLQEILLRTPMRRTGRLSELVGAALFLASDAASFMTGQALVVDGGFLAAGITGNPYGLSDDTAIEEGAGE